MFTSHPLTTGRIPSVLCPNPGGIRLRMAVACVLALVAGLSNAPFAPAVLGAQESPRQPPIEGPESQLLRVTLHNGATYVGEVVDAVDEIEAAGPGQSLHLRLPDGEVMVLTRASIAREETVRGRLRGGEFWPSDPNASRLFFAATGRSLPAGSGTFNAYYGVIPFVGLGLTDRVSIAGGTPLFFGGGDDGRLLYLAPKVQVIRRERVQVAAGVLAFHETGELSDNAYLAYGVATFGPTSDEGITVGLAWGREYDAWSSAPTLMFGLDHRTSRRTKLISENYWSPVGGSGGLASVGVRFLAERFAADLALGTPVGSSGLWVFPLVNFSVGW